MPVTLRKSFSPEDPISVCAIVTSSKPTLVIELCPSYNFLNRVYALKLAMYFSPIISSWLSSSSAKSMDVMT